MPTELQTTPQQRAEARTPPSVIAGIIVVSVIASAFICWLVYYHAPTDVAGTQLRSLPLVNAVSNGLSTIALLIGFSYIRSRNVGAHKRAMFSAFLFSSVFLASYLVNFALHGETHLPIPHHGLLWVSYALLLFAIHIPLAMLALPMILITFFLSLSGRFPAHKKLARWTFPIWLCVSVTGVIVYVMQAVIH